MLAMRKTGFTSLRSMAAVEVYMAANHYFVAVMIPSEGHMAFVGPAVAAPESLRDFNALVKLNAKAQRHQAPDDCTVRKAFNVSLFILTFCRVLSLIVAPRPVQMELV